jgi:hypothetical protein
MSETARLLVLAGFFLQQKVSVATESFKEEKHTGIMHRTTAWINCY